MDDWIAQQVRVKRVSADQISTDDGLRNRVLGLIKWHGVFLDQCRALTPTCADYPFNTNHMGIRSLASAERAEFLRTFERGAHLAGEIHLKGMLKSSSGSTPIASHALDVVEFDGHRLDVRLKLVVRDPLPFVRTSPRSQYRPFDTLCDAHCDPDPDPVCAVLLELKKVRPTPTAIARLSKQE